MPCFRLFHAKVFHMELHPFIASRVRSEDDCLRWKEYVARNGYARTTFQGKSHYAHRLSYLLHLGEIPEGLQVDHVKARGCVFRDCVKPEHLEAVTVAENLSRAGGRTNGSCKRGHLLEGDNVRPVYHGDGRYRGRACRTCDRMRNQGTL